jgi:hypothetical protein
MERELSQLAADGITKDGWDNFNGFWSGRALRIGTIRAPGRNSFGGLKMLSNPPKTPPSSFWYIERG